MEYPKIHSLWKRQGWYFDEDKKNSPGYQAGRQSLIEGDYAIPEFANIKYWQVQEKIDGMNIRIEDSPYSRMPSIYGRTDKADVPLPLMTHLKSIFHPDSMLEVFLKKDAGLPCITIFGEGYGPKIQAGGGNYRKDAGFILFDVKVNNWWLEQSAVEEIAGKFGIPYAPIIGNMTHQEIIDYVKSQPKSLCSITEQVMEGVICRPNPLLLLRNGDPLMMKLKCKEYLPNI